MPPDSCILNSSAPLLSSVFRLLSPRRRASRAAFTLIEILVVIVIIMVLVGIVLSTAKYAQVKAGRSRAEAQIATMEAALENYKSDNGVYPPSTANRQTPSGLWGTIEINNSIDLYSALVGPPKTYMTFKPDQTHIDKATSKVYLVDPFGSPYNYYRPGGSDTATNSTTFDLWSYGPDNKNDTADDIVNWRH